MVYRLTVSYRGSRYSGWQRQPNALTVQEVLEDALSDLLGRETTVVGAGRTDAGVHARGQVVHLESPDDQVPGKLVHGVNRLLPPDVRVLDARAAGAGFHARKSAVSKAYSYRLVQAAVLSPLDSPFAIRVGSSLDLGAMRTATRHLVGRHDFTAFALAGGAHRQPVREVFEADWRESGPELRFHIVGSGFLRGMVRSIVGTLLEVGQGRRAPESVERLLEGASRGEAGPTAPAHGLVLEWVRYPEAVL